MSSFNVFSALKTKMHYTGQRQAVLAQNIANADTPDYKAKDLEPLDFKDTLRASSGLRLSITSPMHIKDNPGVAHFAIEKQSDVFETKPNGNNVILEEQTLMLSKNKIDHEMASNLYRKMVGLVKASLGGGGR